MARKRHKNTVQHTVHITNEVNEWIEENAKLERRTFSNMLDTLLYRLKKSEPVKSEVQA